MGNILFIIWRESLEAVLIIGILHSFLVSRESLSREAPRKTVAYMWSGVAAGSVLSLLLAWITIRIQDGLSGQALDLFQTGILLFCAGLMTQMVIWMNQHGSKMKRQLESELDQAMSDSGRRGVALVACLAVTREGTETFVYLFGLSLENSAMSALMVALMAVLGIGLALLTAWLVARGMRFLNYQRVFRLTSLVLLFSAAGLVISGANRLIEMDLLPPLLNPVWNTTWLLDAGGTFGKIVASLTGYRSRPSLMHVLIYVAYWMVTWFCIRQSAPRRLAAPGLQRA